MEPREQLEFETPIHRRMYEYVEQRGAVQTDALRADVDADPERFDHELAILKRDDYLEETGGTLSVALEVGEEEEHTTNSVNFTIRPARENDLSGVLGAIRTITAEKRHLVAESVAEQLNYEGVLTRHNDVQTRLFFVATVNGDVVGWAHIEGPTMEKLSHTAELTIGVLEAYRGHGIGSHLMHRSLEWAASNGYTKVYQSLPAINEEAIEFLKEHGWQTEAVRDAHYRIDGEFVDEVMLARILE